MGGTGSLQFCGRNNIQLIITRRDPEIIKNKGDDESSDYWGFTVIRREDPVGGMRSSTFRYLAPRGKVLMFNGGSLPLLPGEYPVAYEKPLEWGTFVKLYEYQLIGLIVDCSDFDRRTQEDLFMNSRDRLRDGDLKNEIEDKPEYLIRNHRGLRELREKRRREEIEGKIGDAKPLVEVIEKTIKTSPTLSKLFAKGLRITNPFELRETGTSEEFKGKRFPSYFQFIDAAEAKRNRFFMAPP